ncbi:hypothetical protein C8J57DRAFT_1088401, partial [Mycena rebaudengoi]
MGVLDDSSISQALRANCEPPRLFQGLGCNVPVYDEDLSALLLRYHVSYDPTTNDDPLLAYGAVDRVLPGKTVEETMKFHDMIMHWTLPHRQFEWDYLMAGVASFHEVKPTHHELIAYGTAEDPIFSLGSHLLERVGQLALAITQVLEGLNDFLGKPHHFTLNPNWQLLYLLESNSSRTVILMTFATLQLRMVRACVHISKYINAVRRTYGLEGDDMFSSVDSTRSSVCSSFGTREAHVELAKLLDRPDY